MYLHFRESHLLQIHKRFEQQNLPLDLFLSRYFKSYKSLGSNDRKWIATSLYSMIRWQGLLEYLGKGAPSWETKLSIYKQLTLSICINKTSIPLQHRLSIPLELYKVLQKQFNIKDLKNFCWVSNTEAPVTVRVNTLKTNRETLLKHWQAYDVRPSVKASQGIIFPKRLPLTSLPEFKKGFFEMQDEGSQCIAEMIPISPGDLVIDYCAGGGGKSLAIAPYMQGKGQLYLHDKRSFALAQAKQRLKRAGIQNAQILSFNHPFLQKLKADVMLLDTPCSGTGTYRRNPDMKWKFNTEMLERLISTQQEIFHQGYQITRKGGKIAYVTCSVLDVENTDQVEHFLSFYPLKLLKMKQLHLTKDGMDAFFIAIFEKQTS